jgi:hypothetical protein
MKRSILAALFVLLQAAAARAEGGSIPEFRITPGAGIGLFTLSVELNVEFRRWYGGAQLALAGAMPMRGSAFAPGQSAGVAAFSGLRAGAFLLEAPITPFVGVGLGALGEGNLDNGSSAGWGASAEVGMAFRRDERWLHPQLVLQGILPFAQRSTGSYQYQSTPVVLAAARIFL